MPTGGAAIARSGRPCRLLRRPEYRHLYAGILCTVDLRNDPIAVYEALRAEAPPRVDLLLPHATWAQPPYRPRCGYALCGLARPDSCPMAGRWPPVARSGSSTRCGTPGRGARAVPRLRASTRLDLLVIEADGSWEQVDSIKTAFAGAPETGLDIFSIRSTKWPRPRRRVSRQQGLEALCRTCRECPVVGPAAAACTPTDIGRGNNFDNPSVYCDDLKKLIPVVIARAPGVAVMSGPPGDSLDSLDGMPCPMAASSALQRSGRSGHDGRVRRIQLVHSACPRRHRRVRDRTTTDAN